MKVNTKKSGETHYYDDWARKTSLFQEWAAMKEDAGRERLEQLVSQLEENAAQSGAASFK